MSLEQALRGEALPLLTLWEHAVTMLHGKNSAKQKLNKTAVNSTIGGDNSGYKPLPVTCAGGVASDFSVNLRGTQKDLWSAVIAANAEASWEHNYTQEDVFTAAHIPIKDPLMQLLIHAARRPQMMRVPLLIMEDNEAVIKILLKGRTNALRHLHRTHRINIDWMFEIIKHEHILIRYANTKYQLADICTKAFTKAEGWQRLMQMCQIRPTRWQNPMPPYKNAKKEKEERQCHDLPLLLYQD